MHSVDYFTNKTWLMVYLNKKNGEFAGDISTVREKSQILGIIL